MELPHRQRLILRLLHNLPFSRPFVIDAAKVEDAVDDDTVQFTFVVVIGELFRIGAYGIKADEEVTDLHRTRLLLNNAAQQVLANGLNLLGVSAPERM